MNDINVIYTGGVLLTQSDRLKSYDLLDDVLSG